jgi:osmotically-inducible protein OsmY
MISKRILMVGSTLAAVAFSTGFAASSKNPAADNSHQNRAGHEGSGLNASDQGSSEKDIELTRKIRSSLVEDSTISMMGHNVKIITNKGEVVLKGPVQNLQEKQLIESKARSLLTKNETLQSYLEVKTNSSK